MTPSNKMGGGLKSGGVHRGLFISFEGADGVGKSTQIDLLADRIRDAGREVVLTREPGGSPGAEDIRKLLVEGDADRWSPLTEALLMYAARADHLERTILPALKRGAVVITDRFADSTMAYQGLAGALGTPTVERLSELVVGAHKPDLTVILDLPVAEGLQRANQRGGEARFESKGEAFQQAVRQAFLDVAAAEQTRCVVIDASGDIETVASRISEATRDRLQGLLT